MVIFHSYVSLPEGSWCFQPKAAWVSQQMGLDNYWSPWLFIPPKLACIAVDPSQWKRFISLDISSLVGGFKLFQVPLSSSVWDDDPSWLLYVGLTETRVNPKPCLIFVHWGTFWWSNMACWKNLHLDRISQPMLIIFGYWGMIGDVHPYLRTNHHV